ncbi:hypothetical protein JCM1840_006914 [Sporobolomyces johnsonii]
MPRRSSRLSDRSQVSERPCLVDPASPSSSSRPRPRSPPPSYWPPPSHWRFHCRLQEDALQRVLAQQRELTTLEVQLTSAERELLQLARDQKAHAARMVAALERLNATLDAASDLTSVTRQLASEAIAIGTDIERLSTRFCTFCAESISPHRAGALPDEVVAKLGQTAEEIARSELFEGLFTGVELTTEAAETAQEKWQAVLADEDLEESASPLATNWQCIFALWDSKTGCWPAPNPRPELDDLSPTSRSPGPCSPSSASLYRHFRDLLSTLLVLIATSQLSRMLSMNHRVRILSEQAARARAENHANYAVQEELDARLRSATTRLEALRARTPRVRERLEEGVLSLVVLAKGP